MSKRLVVSTSLVVMITLQGCGFFSGGGGDESAVSGDSGTRFTFPGPTGAEIDVPQSLREAFPGREFAIQYRIGGHLPHVAGVEVPPRRLPITSENPFIFTAGSVFPGVETSVEYHYLLRKTDTDTSSNLFQSDCVENDANGNILAGVSHVISEYIPIGSVREELSFDEGSSLDTKYEKVNCFHDADNDGYPNIQEAFNSSDPADDGSPYRVKYGMTSKMVSRLSYPYTTGAQRTDFGFLSSEPYIDTCNVETIGRNATLLALPSKSHVLVHSGQTSPDNEKHCNARALVFVDVDQSDYKELKRYAILFNEQTTIAQIDAELILHDIYITALVCDFDALCRRLSFSLDTQKVENSIYGAVEHYDGIYFDKKINFEREDFANSGTETCSGLAMNPSEVSSGSDVALDDQSLIPDDDKLKGCYFPDDVIEKGSGLYYEVDSESFFSSLGGVQTSLGSTLTPDGRILIGYHDALRGTEAAPGLYGKDVKEGGALYPDKPIALNLSSLYVFEQGSSSTNPYPVSFAGLYGLTTPGKRQGQYLLPNNWIDNVFDATIYKHNPSSSTRDPVCRIRPPALPNYSKEYYHYEPVEVFKDSGSLKILQNVIKVKESFDFVPNAKHINGILVCDGSDEDCSCDPADIVTKPRIDIVTNPTNDVSHLAKKPNPDDLGNVIANPFKKNFGSYIMGTFKRSVTETAEGLRLVDCSDVGCEQKGQTYGSTENEAVGRFKSLKSVELSNTTTRFIELASGGASQALRYRDVPNNNFNPLFPDRNSDSNSNAPDNTQFRDGVYAGNPTTYCSSGSENCHTSLLSVERFEYLDLVSERNEQALATVHRTDSNKTVVGISLDKIVQGAVGSVRLPNSGVIEHGKNGITLNHLISSDTNRLGQTILLFEKGPGELDYSMIYHQSNIGSLASNSAEELAVNFSVGDTTKDDVCGASYPDGTLQLSNLAVSISDQGVIYISSDFYCNVETEQDVGGPKWGHVVWRLDE